MAFAAGTSPVGRTSVDRDADLLAALLREGLFADAKALCESRLVGAGPDSLEGARWVVGLTRVRACELLSHAAISDDEFALLNKPVTALAEAYPRSNFGLFLTFQSVEILRAACFQDCVSASINGADSAEAQRAIARSAKLIHDSEDLIQRVQQQRLAADKASGTAAIALAKDLEELDQRLHIGVVQTMLAITEVFAGDSDDQRDAATKAVRYADTSLQSLSSGSRGWAEMQLLRIEAMLRAGNTAAAIDALESVPPGITGDGDSQRLALQLRLGLADGRWEIVASALSEFYGEDPEQASRSFEMDLVRLRFLLRLKGVPSEKLKTLAGVPRDLDQAINDWIDGIATRNGAYERRRAESIVLSELKVSAGNDLSSAGGLDPSLVAMQGEEWLRRGDLARGAELLAAAAVADSDAHLAIAHASKSAAAYVASGDPAKAASILYRVAMIYTGDAQSPAMAVQAAMLLGKTNDKRYHMQVETMLRETIATWPIDGPVVPARRWLIDGLQRQNRRIDAAEVATLNLQSHFDLARLNELVSLWRTAATAAPRRELDALSGRFQTAFAAEPINTNEFTKAAYLASAAFAMSREKLSSIETPKPDPQGEITIPLALLRFRQSLVVDDSLLALDEPSQADAQRRLMNDALADPNLRKPVAQLIESWPGIGSDSIDHVQRLIWLSQRDQARAAARDLVAMSDTRGIVIRELAMAFASSDEAIMKTESVHWWDELSSGLPRGSDAWHEAKLRAAQLSDASEATKRAKYILLTQPPDDAAIRQQYESLADGEAR